MTQRDALERLEALIGLAPGEVARRRLERQPGLLQRALPQPPGIEDAAWAAVIDAVTVQETRLFRHPTQVLQFRAAALPDLARAAAARGATRLRLLSAGCATGEEAWTLAALGADAIAETGLRLGLEVVGLDLSRPALRHAARGQYRAGPPDPLRDVPPAYHAQFPAARDGIAVAPALRGRARFRRANLLEVAPDGAGFDAVVCRNVGIYLTDAARDAVARRLVAQLVPGGALLLGPTDRVPADAGMRPWTRDAVSLFRRAEGAA
ncbi:hypothetical protein CKO45_25725 [Paracraurococcus ruber]|uniref:CheR-type methyltransferase domain-containing protein n=1 Tax=Paracraurococcus ruber TaxID=77675 RepID=A0ABS1D563_9PROT|nr:CheR family methyltransferase [Paracraurococcus ruber]MBK1661611.1 hypothetical protein [Paracraurococcus ruber]